MNDVHRNPAFASNTQRLGHRLEHSDAFRPHMGRIDSTELRCRLAHCDEALGIDPGSGWPTERTGDTERPLASIVRLAGWPARRPIAAIFPSRIATSPTHDGLPVPSTMRALAIRTSKSCP